MDDPKDKKEKKPDDFADIAAAGRLDNVTRLVRPEKPPPEKLEKWQENLRRADFNLSDRWLAQCVFDRHPNQFRYVSNRPVWMYYTGSRWEDDDDGLKLHGKIRDLLDHDDFKAVARKLKDKLHLGSSSCHSAVLRQLREMYSCKSDIFDTDFMLLNCPGGTFDARTGQMREHRWSDFITKITVADPIGPCPIWIKHIDFVTCADKPNLPSQKRLIAYEFGRYLKAFAGYALFGAGRDQIIPFLYGDTNNGKSTFLRAMALAIGDYGVPDFPAEALMMTSRNQHREILTPLNGARFAVSTEVPDDAQWNTILLKKLSGNEQITANKMFQNSTTFLWAGTLALAGNSAPSFRSIDGSIKRRLHVIPFDAHVEAGARDKHIDDKLKLEAGGILRWMIEGYDIYREEGLVMPEAVRRATDEYIASQDHIKEWVDEYCQTNPGFTQLTTFKDLHASYSKFSEDNKLPTISKIKLIEAMRRMQFGEPGSIYQLTEVKTKQARGFYRIILKT